MPRLETHPVIERKRFILEWLEGVLSIAELCRRHDVSRKTGYKW
ncbi:MAG: helix-turn-helix domain-containing protein, partial [Gemmatimonadetes bacterium]|nr:helix-turn-helix domain-containing protein [Gemmatimonadota bacterium]